jgi:hypothetical protein
LRFLPNSLEIWHSFYAAFRNKKTMDKQTSRGRGQDRSKVAGGQDHEVNYEKDKLNVSGKQVKDAVKSTGNSRKKVEEKLKK